VFFLLEMHFYRNYGENSVTKNVVCIGKNFKHRGPQFESSGFDNKIQMNTYDRKITRIESAELVKVDDKNATGNDVQYYGSSFHMYHLPWAAEIDITKFSASELIYI